MSQGIFDEQDETRQENIEHAAEIEQRHDVIWLQAWCDGCQEHCGDDGRTWCSHDAWGPCEECGRKPVKYVLASLTSGQGK